MSIYTIYKATNTANHKSYIGFDSHWPNRMRQHICGIKYEKNTTKFHRALKKYGKDVFSWEILYQSKDANHCLTVMEPHFIKEYNSAKSGYNSSTGGEGSLGCIWWNNGINQSFSAAAPDSTYFRGRLPFNNVGSKLGSDIQRNQRWVNNNSIEKMVPKGSAIDPGFYPGRLKTKAFGGKKNTHTIGTHWWNNGKIQIMSKTQPGGDFIRGRIKIAAMKKIIR